MKIYLVLKRIDLGTQVESAWKDKEKAVLESKRLNDQHKKMYPWMEEYNIKRCSYYSKGTTFLVKEITVQ